MPFGKFKLKWQVEASLLEWPKSRTLMPSNASEEMKSHLVLMGMQNGTATLKDNFSDFLPNILITR
jgi:hypothetical protein